MFSKICQNWRSLVARRREGQSLAAPRRPPALSGVHSSDDPFTDPNPAEKLQHKLSRLCFKQLLIETLRSTTTPPTDNGLFKPTQIDVCHVGESYDAESCREHFKILIQFNYFCKVQKCIHPNPSQPQQIRLQLLLKHTTLNVKVQFFRRIDKLKAIFCNLYDVDLIFVWLRGYHWRLFV